MTDPERVIRVNFRKQVSDGNYGTEAAEVTLEWYVDGERDGDADGEFARMMLEEARRYVHAELLKSPSERVRSAIERQQQRPRMPAPHVDDDDEDLPL